MAFSGKFELESEKNYDEFMKRLGEWPPEHTFPGWPELAPRTLGRAGQGSIHPLTRSLTHL